MNIALIIAGGIGHRMKQEIPKQFLNVYDKPVIIYTLEAFQSHPGIDEIGVACLDGWHDVLRAYARQYKIDKLKWIVSGGDTGQASIRNGVFEAEKRHDPEDIILVHDANRPLVSHEIISDCIIQCQKYGSAVAMVPCVVPILHKAENNESFEALPREDYVLVQNPQAYPIGILANAHREALERGITSSVTNCTLMIELGKSVHFSIGSETNIKLTTPDDLKIFKALLAIQKQRRSLMRSPRYQNLLDRFCENCSVLSQLKGKTILLSGATGMLGSFLIDAVMTWNQGQSIEERCKIIAVNRSLEKAKARFQHWKNCAELQLLQHDVCVPFSAISESVDYIIHAASNADPVNMAKYPSDTLMANVLGTKNLLDYGLSHGMKRFLFVSSSEVYGQPDQNMSDFTEDYCGALDLSNPRSCYPEGKRASEVLCQSYISQYNADAVIVRPCHLFGPTMRERDSHAVAEFLCQAARGEDVEMKSAGLLERSHCYVADAVQALLLVLRDGVCGEAYNIADRRYQMTIHEFAEQAAKAGGGGHCRVIRTQLSDVEARGYSRTKRAVLNASKLEALGWVPMQKETSAIAEAVAILREGLYDIE